MYLVMNDETGHYDIYAKVIDDTRYGNFAATYGIEFAEGEEGAQIAVIVGNKRFSFAVSSSDTIETVASKLNERMKNDNCTASFDSDTGLIRIVNGDGQDMQVTVKLGYGGADDAVCTPVALTASVVRLDDTTVDLSGYQPREGGKGLSSNDYTAEDKTKLSGIAEGATKVEASDTPGCIRIGGTDVQVVDIATPEEIAAMMDELFGTDTPEA